MLRRLINNMFGRTDASIIIRDLRVIADFSADPLNTFLVSFPRTGSHWLRMLMELYFERPSLTRLFFYLDKKDYLSLHTHDMDLAVERSHVIYLYRNPVETIYSQLRYYDEDLEDQSRILHWTDLYGRHLNKWLIQEKFTEKKTIIRYENLKTNPHREFRKVTEHFNAPFDRERFDRIAALVSKENVKGKTLHDPQVVNLNQKYAESRRTFKTNFQSLILSTLFDGRKNLMVHFEGIDD